MTYLQKFFPLYAEYPNIKDEIQYENFPEFCNFRNFYKFFFF